MARRPVDKIALLRAAREATEDLIRRVYRLEVAKALDPTDPDDFLVIRARLASALKSATGSIESDALVAALQELDVDWPNLSMDQQKAVIKASQDVLHEIPQQALPVIDLTLGPAGERIVRATKKELSGQLELSIGADLSATDERIVDFIRQSQSNFIRDEYGSRAEDFSDRAREIVADALEEGLGRDEIAERLTAELGPGSDAGLAKMDGYWENIATIYSNRARNFAALSTMDEADISYFKFEAVMDEVTSRICRVLHGRVFSVDRGLKRFEQVARSRDPERVTTLQPFVSEGTDDDGNSGLFFKGSGGQRRRADDLTDDELEAAGLSVPPLHGNCRSTIVAVDESEASSGGE